MGDGNPIGEKAGAWADASMGAGGCAKCPNRVYVVDDDEDVRRSTCLLLSALGIECQEFTGGRRFLDAVEGLAPACVLLDLRMPDVSGLEVQSELARMAVHWPIIFASGSADLPPAATHGGGSVQYLAKPFSEEQLIAALSKGFSALDRQGNA